MANTGLTKDNLNTLSDFLRENDRKVSFLNDVKSNRGIYNHVCPNCGVPFTGHKDRRECRACA